MQKITAICVCVSLYVRVNRVLVCVRALDVAKSRIAVSSAAVDQHRLLGVRACMCVRVCVCENISVQGVGSVSVKCLEGRESSYITLLNHIHHPVPHTHSPDAGRIYSRV